MPRNNNYYDDNDENPWQTFFRWYNNDFNIFIPKLVEEILPKSNIVLPKKFINKSDIDKMLKIISDLRRSSRWRNNEIKIFEHSIYKAITNLRIQMKINKKLDEIPIVAFAGDQEFFCSFNNNGEYEAFEDFDKTIPLASIFCGILPIPREHRRILKILFIEKKEGFINYYWASLVSQKVDHFYRRKIRTVVTAINPIPFEQEDLDEPNTPPPASQQQPAHVEVLSIAQAPRANYFIPSIAPPNTIQALDISSIPSLPPPPSNLAATNNQPSSSTSTLRTAQIIKTIESSSEDEDSSDDDESPKIRVIVLSSDSE